MGWFGKMPLEEFFVYRNIFYPDGLFPGFQLDNPVNQEKRIAVGKQVLYVLNIHHSVLLLSSF